MDANNDIAGSRLSLSSAVKKISLAVILAILAIAGLFVFNRQTVPQADKLPDADIDAVVSDSDGATDAGKQPVQDGSEDDADEAAGPGLTDTEQVEDANNGTGPQEAENETETVPNEPSEGERFVVALDGGTVEKAADSLLEQGFISDKAAFIKALAAKDGETIAAGGYKLAKGMNAVQIANVLRAKPYMKWVVIPEGLRKEEIAVLLADALGWTAAQKDKWISDYTAMKFDYIEGVYFPDTYLIPVDEDQLRVAERLQAKFNEKFAAYLPEFNAQNIKWTTGLTFASIVQREAASKADMPLIAGILWNRLEQGMALNVDATLQYVRGDTGNGWWAQISLADKQTDSPYNTYLNKGLPPHPISNPGISAIEATLYPSKTDCLYYLHDNGRVTHCAKTYEDHLANIETYLKDSQ